MEQHTDTDEAQRRRLARILGDPTAYFAEHRRQAHEQARRLLDARLDEQLPQPAR